MRGTRTRVAMAAGALLLTLGFLALGTWQVARRGAKLALIERIETRIHAAPVAAPGPAQWPQVDAAHHEYRHVRLEGRFLAQAETRVQAVTARGPGWWIVTPLQQADGSSVLVNRGYAPDASPVATPEATVVVTGLLRMTEPHGAFLRRNDPAANRWYSRDVAAIAQARGLQRVAPYFVDADAGASDAPPVGGLTVVRLPNNHLVYALTWYTLAGMSGWAAWRVRRERAPAATGTDDAPDAA